MNDTYNLIANPTSKGGLIALKKVEQELNALNVTYNTYICERAIDARPIVSEICKGGGNIIAIGGDGTFHNVINAITDFSKVKVGFVAGGTGNDFADTLGVNTDPCLAIKDILRGETELIDLIDVSGIKCLNVASTGLDIEVLRTYEKVKIFKGKARYYWALLKTLLRFSSYKTVLTVDGLQFERDALVVAAGNGRCFGGGMVVTPHAKLTDGKISVTVINRIKKIQIPTKLPKFVKGKHDKLKGIAEHYDCDEFEVFLPKEKAPAVEIDGEIINGHPFKCKLLPSILRVFKPQIAVK